MRHMKAQVCDVNKALLSVHRVVQAGNKVVFSASGKALYKASRQEKRCRWRKRRDVHVETLGESPQRASSGGSVRPRNSGVVADAWASAASATR